MAVASNKRIAVLGSTGSIGRSTLEVIEGSGGALRASVLTAHTHLELAQRQCQRLRPDCLVITNPESVKAHDLSNLPSETRLAIGEEALEGAVRDPSVDTVVAAIAGSAGLRGTWAAVDAGKRVALANKETLVIAGPLVMRLVAERDATLIPVDSEHSAVFQALSAGRAEEVRRIVLTASGGPFLRHSRGELERVTVEQALRHPTWSMGPQITIDSATMMNKALEIIEARWLFDLCPDQIEVVVHPQSIVHSFVEFVDGSVLAQMGPPDMRLPIQYALTYPDRCPGVAQKIDWSQVMRLDFEPPDWERFPAIPLGLEVARAGGTAGAALIAAKEAAVRAFLDGGLAFGDIVRTCRAVVEHHNFDPQPTLEELMRIDNWARQEVTKWTCASS